MKCRRRRLLLDKRLIENRKEEKDVIDNIRIMRAYIEMIYSINDEIYHLGVSLKDLGKKWFAFSILHFNKELLLNNTI